MTPATSLTRRCKKCGHAYSLARWRVPGSISRHTHSVVRELTPDVAEKFRTLCSYAMCSMDGKRPIVVATLTTSTILGERGDSLKEHGLDYGAFIELADYRLVSLPLEGSLQDSRWRVEEGILFPPW